MFREVDEKNQGQLNEFNNIWVECWKEKGYELEFTTKSDKFIVLNEEEVSIGTIEFIEYNAGENACEEVFPFKDLIEVKTDSNRIVEIDKISLIKKYRGRNIYKILYIISKYTKDHNLKYGVGLMEPTFYKAMKLFYKIPVTRLSKKVFYKGDWVIPVLVDVESIYTNPEKYDFVDKYKSTAIGNSLENVIV